MMVNTPTSSQNHSHPDNDSVWEPRYFVFENEVIKYARQEHAAPNEWVVIPIRFIVSFRVEVCTICCATFFFT